MTLRGLISAILIASILHVSHALALPKNDPGDDDTGGGSSSGGGSPPSPASPPALFYIGWDAFSVEGECYFTEPDHELCGLNEDSVLSDGDHIWVTSRSGAQFSVGSEEIEIVLTTAPEIRWWKEVKAYNTSGLAVNWIQTQDDNHGPVSMRIKVNELESIIFSKAKFLGVHDSIYKLTDLKRMAGMRVEFRWTCDNQFALFQVPQTGCSSGTP